jgi:hypothetical protein
MHVITISGAEPSVNKVFQAIFNLKVPKDIVLVFCKNTIIIAHGVVPDGTRRGLNIVLVFCKNTLIIAHGVVPDGTRRGLNGKNNLSHVCDDIIITLIMSSHT